MSGLIAIVIITDSENKLISDACKYKKYVANVDKYTKNSSFTVRIGQGAIVEYLKNLWE
jgi:DNA-binding MurR/RpiR family transcriptional regulator